MNLLTRETYVNATERYRFGAGEWEESFTDNRGQLFKALTREYGRCTSKMYITTKTEEAKPVGWVFEKRARYDDARSHNGRYSEKDYYLQETWVEVRDVPLCARCGKDEDAHHEFTVSKLIREREQVV